MAPAGAPVSRQREVGVDGVVPHEGEVDGYHDSGPPATARVHPDVRTRQRVPEGRRGHRIHERPAPSHDRAPALVLVDGEVHAAPPELGQRALDSLRPNEPIEIPVLASGRAEQGAVHAGALPVDGPPHETEKHRLPSLEPPPESGERVGQVERSPERPGKPQEQPRPRGQVLPRHGAGLRHPIVASPRSMRARASRIVSREAA